MSPFEVSSALHRFLFSLMLCLVSQTCLVHFLSVSFLLRVLKVVILDKPSAATYIFTFSSFFTSGWNCRNQNSVRHPYFQFYLSSVLVCTRFFLCGFCYDQIALLFFSNKLFFSILCIVHEALIIPGYPASTAIWIWISAKWYACISMWKRFSWSIHSINIYALPFALEIVRYEPQKCLSFITGDTYREHRTSHFIKWKTITTLFTIRQQ